MTRDKTQNTIKTVVYTIEVDAMTRREMLGDGRPEDS